MTDEICQILGDAGVASSEFSRAPGFANEVVMTDEHVIRLNDGRFVDAFAHEADVLRRLKGILPVPDVIAVGHRDGGGEFIVLERLPGENLEDAWPTLTPHARRAIVEELGSILRTLHLLPLQSWMRCRWVELAIELREARNAYHAPPGFAPVLLEATRRVRPDLLSLLEDVSRFIADRLELFAEDPMVFVHTDVHFRNVIVNQGRITGIIDFEGSHPGTPDIDCDMLIRWLLPRDDLPDQGFANVLVDLHRSYPGILDTPDLLARLEVHELMWMLVQTHHWQPGAGWMPDPAIAMRDVLDGVVHSRIDRLLSQVGDNA
jgi:aminoglycoside phosphotransferase (APT) family kinase protein